MAQLKNSLVEGNLRVLGNIYGPLVGDVTGNITGNVTGALTGNATSATQLATTRYITLTGDATGSASFNGTANASIAVTLKNSGVTAGTYKRVTVNAKGIVTSGDNTDANDNTTYTFASGTNKFTVTPSNGTAQEVTVTPSITNNITGSGTNGYLTKFNGTNTITNGPAIGTGTTKYLREDGTWVVPPDTTTDTKNTAGSTNNAGTKLFIVGASSQAANPQTYSNVNCYIGTNNKLYSNGVEVLTAHPTVTLSTNTTSTAAPAHGGTFTAIDSITKDSNGHVTKVNTKTITLPGDVDCNVTQTVTTSANTSKRPILLGYSYSDASPVAFTTVNGTAYATHNISVAPSAGYLYAERLYSGGNQVLTAHPSITLGTDTTSTASPGYGGTFTVVDGVTKDSNGHVTKINTKTVTLPSGDNTWRGIQNVLTSDSTTESLSAKQGKVLKGLVDGKASIDHNHTISQITDFPASLPANGGDADTVDGLHAASFIKTISTASGANINSVGTPSVTVSGGTDNTILTFDYLKGAKGDPGADGSQGVSVSSITQTTTSTADGGTNVITATLSSGASTTFNIKNGSKGNPGTNGSNGADGVRGSRWTGGTAITGTSTTATVFATGITDSLINDMYLNSSTGNTYRCTLAGNASVAKWVYVGCIKGVQGEQGNPGSAGTNGTNGTNGVRGSRWSSGTAITGTSTTATVFATGITDSLINDMYLNSSTGNTYRCTVAGNASTAKWVYAGSIKGAQGNPGTNGTNGTNGSNGAAGTRGSRWSSGTSITGTSTTATVFATGITDSLINDMYLNSSTGNTYRCTVAGNASTAKWIYIGCIKGVQGNPGTNGTNGSNGLEGMSIYYTNVEPYENTTNINYIIKPSNRTVKIGDLVLYQSIVYIITNISSYNVTLAIFKDLMGPTGPRGNDGLTTSIKIGESGTSYTQTNGVITLPLATTSTNGCIKIGTTETTCAAGNHSHNYAGSASAGGSALSLTGFINTTTAATVIDSATTNGHVYVNGTTGIYNQSDGACFVQAYSSSWVGQIYQDYRTGQIALRGKKDGTWQSWRKVLDSSNFNTWAAAKSHSHNILDIQGPVNSPQLDCFILTNAGGDADSVWQDNGLVSVGYAELSDIAEETQRVRFYSDNNTTPTTYNTGRIHVISGAPTAGAISTDLYFFY